MGMDWHSSGITTSVICALKRGLAPLGGSSISRTAAPPHPARRSSTCWQPWGQTVSSVSSRRSQRPSGAAGPSTPRHAGAPRCPLERRVHKAAARHASSGSRARTRRFSRTIADAWRWRTHGAVACHGSGGRARDPLPLPGSRAVFAGAWRQGSPPRRVHKEAARHASSGSRARTRRFSRTIADAWRPIPCRLRFTTRPSAF
jgi:hypothetical protein